MLHEEPTKKREQISMVCIDELVLLLLHVVSPAVFCVILSLQVNPRSCKLAGALHIIPLSSERNLP